MFVIIISILDKLVEQLIPPKKKIPVRVRVRTK